MIQQMESDRQIIALKHSGMEYFLRERFLLISPGGGGGMGGWLFYAVSTK